MVDKQLKILLILSPIGSKPKNDFNILLQMLLLGWESVIVCWHTFDFSSSTKTLNMNFTWFPYSKTWETVIQTMIWLQFLWLGKKCLKGWLHLHPFPCFSNGNVHSAESRKHWRLLRTCCVVGWEPPYNSTQDGRTSAQQSHSHIQQCNYTATRSL